MNFPEAMRTLNWLVKVSIWLPYQQQLISPSMRVHPPYLCHQGLVYVAYVSYGGGSYWGTSCLVNLLGNTVVCAGSEDALLIAQISTDTVSVITQYFHDRRPELYQEVV